MKKGWAWRREKIFLKKIGKEKGTKKKKRAKLFFSSLIFPVLSQSLVPQVEGVCGAKPVPSAATATAAKSLQSCPTVRPRRWKPTRPLVPGILQAGTLEWVPFPSPMHESEK